MRAPVSPIVAWRGSRGILPSRDHVGDNSLLAEQLLMGQKICQ